jgi:hypothetical protein
MNDKDERFMKEHRALQTVLQQLRGISQPERYLMTSRAVLGAYWHDKSFRDIEFASPAHGFTTRNNVRELKIRIEMLEQLEVEE